MKLFPSIALALACAVAGAACESPTEPTESNNGTPNCRTAAASSQSVQTFADGQVVTTNQTCAFNAAETEVNCQMTFTDSVFGPGTGTQTTRWTSLTDLLDEVAVNPPRPRSLGTTTVLTSNGFTLTTTSTNTYDGQQRLTSTAVVNDVTTATTTFTAWDSARRPTAGTMVTTSPGGTQTFPVTNTYDNSNRTVVRVTALNRCTQTHDQNGNVIAETCTGTTPSSTTTTIASTAQACR